MHTLVTLNICPVNQQDKPLAKSTWTGETYPSVLLSHEGGGISIFCRGGQEIHE